MRRPDEISGDLRLSESAWLHALEARRGGSSVRSSASSRCRRHRRSARPAISTQALEAFDREGLDSLLSVCEVEDYFNWRVGTDGPEPINYDYHNRRMRQQIEKRYLENGSFYVFSAPAA